MLPDCGKLFKHDDTEGTTSNMSRHLKNQHASWWQQWSSFKSTKGRPIQKADGALQRTASAGLAAAAAKAGVENNALGFRRADRNGDHDALNLRFAEMIVIGHWPLSMGDDLSFRWYCHALQPSYAPPHRTMTTDIINTRIHTPLVTRVRSCPALGAGRWLALTVARLACELPFPGEAVAGESWLDQPNVRLVAISVGANVQRHHCALA
jgi:hypothetical protein